MQLILVLILCQIPADVASKIREMATDEYPNDTRLRDYEIEKEEEAYEELIALHRIDGVPDSVLTGILRRAKNASPLDYSQQLYEVNQEADSYIEFDQMESARGIPEEEFRRVRKWAVADSPNDFSMQLYTTKQEFQAYRDFRDDNLFPDVSAQQLDQFRRICLRKSDENSMQLFELKDLVKDYREYR